MLCIDNPYTHPCFNLAAEEYLFKSVNESVLMIWQNDPVVVIGKHQEAGREINGPLAAGRGIRLVRRLTGGGAVYHDRGNLNLTLIGNRYVASESRLVETMRDFLRLVDVEAWVDERKNIRIGSRKVSGSAQGVYKDRWLHHATLLFSSDLETLQAVLDPGDSPGREPSGRPRIAVESVRSPVANVSEYVRRDITLPVFRRRLFDYVAGCFPHPRPYIFTPRDLSAIRYLKENKYDTRLWNYRMTEPAAGHRNILLYPVVL